MMTRRVLLFTAPRQVEVRSEALPEPGTGQVRVHTHRSAISAGTEGLIYAGLFPNDLNVDEGLSSLAGEFNYPLKYGYCSVGQVQALGPQVAETWLGRWVFAFNPHESDFVAQTEALLPLPPQISPEAALFLPNLETAVNLLMDGAPLIGERVAVLGQGIVGLLTTALLGRFPLAQLLCLDHYPLRREAALRLGANASLSPADLPQADPFPPDGADLIFELTGSPGALDSAIALAGYDSRIVIGSWYGQKRAALDLGGKFHRSHLHLIASQVTRLPPHLSGRWDKARRFALVWVLLRQIQPEQLITHRFALADAAEAYALLDTRPEQALQVILTYD